MKEISIFKIKYNIFEIVWFAVFFVAAIILSMLFKDTWIGFIAFLSGVICVLLAAKGSRWNYIIGIINCLAYGYVSFVSNLYGEVIENILVYLPLQFVGFFLWKKFEQNQIVKMKKLSVTKNILIFVIAILLTIIGGFLLGLIETQATPFIDSFTNIFSLLATILMLLRYRESWFVYILVNVVSIVMWVIRAADGVAQAYLMIVMWSAYFVNSIYGFYNWTRQLNKTPLEVKNEKV